MRVKVRLEYFQIRGNILTKEPKAYGVYQVWDRSKYFGYHKNITA